MRRLGFVITRRTYHIDALGHRPKISSDNAASSDGSDSNNQSKAQSSKSSWLGRVWSAINSTVLTPLGRLITPAWDDPNAMIGDIVKTDIREFRIVIYLQSLFL